MSAFWFSIGMLCGGVIVLLGAMVIARLGVTGPHGSRQFRAAVYDAMDGEAVWHAQQVWFASNPSADPVRALRQDLELLGLIDHERVAEARASKRRNTAHRPGAIE